MKKTLLFLALNFALSAPVIAVPFALIAGTNAIMKVHPQQALAKLQRFQLPSAQPAKASEISRAATNNLPRGQRRAFWPTKKV
jgi:ABC-type amino acid transport system permease subunit